MGGLFSSSKDETTPPPADETSLQRFTRSVRKSLRIKEHSHDSPSPSGAATRPVELQAQQRYARTPLPESFRQGSASPQASPKTGPGPGASTQPQSVSPVVTPAVKTASPPAEPATKASPVRNPAQTTPKTETAPATTKASEVPVRPVITEGVKSALTQHLPSTQANQERARMMMGAMAADSRSPPTNKLDLKSGTAQHRSEENETATELLDVIISRATELDQAGEEKIVPSTIAANFKVPSEPPKTSALIDVLNDEVGAETPAKDKAAAVAVEPATTEKRSDGENITFALVKSIKMKDVEMHSSSTEKDDHTASQDKAQPTAKELESVLATAITKKEVENELVAALASGIKKEEEKIHSSSTEKAASQTKEQPTAKELESVLATAITKKEVEKELVASLASAIKKEEAAPAKPEASPVKTPSETTPKTETTSDLPVRPVITEGVKSALAQHLPSAQANQERARMMMGALKSDTAQQEDETASELLDDIISRTKELDAEQQEVHSSSTEKAASQTKEQPTAKELKSVLATAITKKEVEKELVASLASAIKKEEAAPAKPEASPVKTPSETTPKTETTSDLPVRPVITEGVKSALAQHLPSAQANQERARMMMGALKSDTAQQEGETASELLDVIISRTKELDAEQQDKGAEDQPKKEKEAEPSKASALMDVLTMEDETPAEASSPSGEASSKGEPDKRENITSKLLMSIKAKDAEMHHSTDNNNNNDDYGKEKDQPSAKELESALAGAITQKGQEAQQQKQLFSTLASAIEKEEEKLQATAESKGNEDDGKSEHPAPTSALA